MQQGCCEERDYGFELVEGTGQGCRYERDYGFELVEGTEKVINGDKFCHNSFGCLEDCAGNDDEGIDEVLTSKKFEVLTSEKFEVLSSEKLEPATLRKSYKEVATGDPSEVFHRIESKKEKRRPGRSVALESG